MRCMYDVIEGCPISSFPLGYTIRGCFFAVDNVMNRAYHPTRLWLECEAVRPSS